MNIEELAFKDRRTLVNLNEPDLLNIIEFLQIDRKQWINQFSKTHNESVEIQKENQELKKKYENAVADYETTMAEKNELKKQLEEINNFIKKSGFVNIEQVMLSYCGLLTQQKEFINYLENEINKLKEQIKNYDIWHEVGTDINFLILKKQFYLEILQKYKEIIGGNNDNNR